VDQLTPIEEIKVGDIIKQHCAIGCRDYMAAQNCPTPDGKDFIIERVISVTKNFNYTINSNWYLVLFADGQTAYGWKGTLLTKIV
jgi:hypothetical protein